MTIVNNSVKVEQQRNSITSTVGSSALGQCSEQIDFLPAMMMKHQLLINFSVCRLNVSRCNTVESRSAKRTELRQREMEVAGQVDAVSR